MKYASILFVLAAVLLLSGCSILGFTPRTGIPVAIPGDTALDTTVARLALIAGIAAIACVASGVALKQYATALVGGPALAGLALVFLLLPAIADAVKWLLIGSVVLCIGGAAWLAYSRWKAHLAIKLTAKHADRMEQAMTEDDIVTAKNKAHAEQVYSGVDRLIAKVRGI